MKLPDMDYIFTCVIIVYFCMYSVVRGHKNVLSVHGSLWDSSWQILEMHCKCSYAYCL